MGIAIKCLVSNCKTIKYYKKNLLKDLISKMMNALEFLTNKVF